MKHARTLIATLLLGTLLVAAGAALAAPGDRDTSFGTNGSVDLLLGESNDILVSLLHRADGKLVAVGQTGDDIGLARYLPSGARDTTFGTDGLARYRKPDAAVRPTAAAEQADGKIVVLASCGGAFNAPSPFPCLFRFNEDGSFDSTLEAPAFPANTFGYNGLALQPDGKIVLSWSGGLFTLYGAIRLLPSGQFDPSFGANGVAAVDAGTSVTARSLVVQPDGRIAVLAGNGAAVRFNADGSRDVSFNAGPLANVDTWAIARQPDGKLVLAGCQRRPSPSGMFSALIRLNPDGSPDASFGSEGTGIALVGGPERCSRALVVRPDGRIVSAAVPIVGSSPLPLIAQSLANGFSAGSAEFRPGGTLSGSLAALALQPDGKVVAGGSLWNRNFALDRYHPSLEQDTSFAPHPFEFWNGRFSTILAARVLASGKLVVVALMNDSHASPDIPVLPRLVVARRLADGSPDPDPPYIGVPGQVTVNGSSVTVATVLPDGTVLTAELENGTIVYRVSSSGSRTPIVTIADTKVTAMEALPDGRVVLSGYTYAPAKVGIMAARILANGQLDPAFGTAGVARHAVPFYESHTDPGVLAVGADGRIVIGSVASTPFSAIRLLADGSIDSSFGTGGIAAFPHPREPQAPYSSLGAALVHADGRVTLAGTEKGKRVFCGFDGYGTNAAFARMNPNGIADAATPGAGFLSGRLGPFNPDIQRARLDTADRVVAGGTNGIGCSFGVGLGDVYRRNASIAMRFTPSGALDTRFGNGGVVTLVSNPAWESVTSDVQVAPGGRIIVATSTQTSSSSRLTLHALQGGGDSAPIGAPSDIEDDGIPNGVEMAEGRDPFVRDNDVFASARLFVMQQYRDFLGREGDAGGITAWTNFMTGAETRATVADSFLRSAEFEGTAAPMTRLYFAYFLRIPDYGGLSFWISQFRAGNSLETISNAFAGSAEFANTYGALDNAGFVDRVYRNVLGRAPDAGGLAFWAGRLDAGMTRGQMMVEFSESPEYRALIANEVYVTMVYAGMLRRAPDPSGFSFWVNYLDAGNSGITLIDGFLAGAEYRAGASFPDERE